MRRMLFAAGLLGMGTVMAQEVGPLASFETDADNPFTVVGGAVVQRVEEHATDGRSSLKVAFKGAAVDTWPGIQLRAPATGAWVDREMLELDVFLAGDQPQRLSTRFAAEGRDPVFGGTALKPGWNKGWSVNLKALRAATDVGRATGLLLYASKPREDMTIFVDNVRWSRFQARFRRLEYLETRARPQPAPADQARGFIAWGHSPLETVFQANRAAGRLDALRLVVARDELEPVAFSVYALRDLAGVTVTVSELRGPDGAAIPAAAWDVRAMRYLDKRVTYSSDTFVAAVPSYLAAVTAPVALAADRSQTFQLVLRGPADAVAGVYSGRVTIAGGADRQDVPLQVAVVPWRLPEAAGLLYGEYYRPVGRPEDARERIRADLADMRRQGMTTVGLCFGVGPTSYTRDGEAFAFHFAGDTAFDWFMETYVALGFPGAVVLLSDSGQAAAAPLGALGTPAFDRGYANFHQALAAALEAKGWPELYIQPVDEPGWQSQADRDRNVHLLRLLKAAGIRTEQDGPGDGYFHHEAGPYADLWNYNGALASAETTAKALAEGRLVTFYNNDVEGYRPEVDRWAYGLFNWRWRLHGGFNWEYRGGSGDLYDNLDSEHGDWVHNYLPQGLEPGGPGTGWEGSREGVDDRRYLLETEGLIARATQAGGEAARLAAAARADLDDLRQRFDASPRLRGRAAFSATLTPEQARQQGLAGNPAATGYVTGALKQPNGLAYAEYDAIRWLVARHAWQMRHALGDAPAVPAAAAPAPPAAERLTVLGRGTDSGPHQAPRPATRVPQLAATPRLDGAVAGDPGWDDAAQVSLTLNDGSGKPEMPTEARFGLRDGSLFVAFVCAETQIPQMLASVRVPDGDVWKDDCVELFLDPGLSGKSCYQVIVNSLGTVARVGPPGAAWKPEVRAAARVDQEQRRWVVEMAVPVAGLRLGPRFGLNLARERRPLEVLELSTWSPTGGAFAQPERFGIAVLEGDLPAAPGEPEAELTLGVTPGYALTRDTTATLTLEVRAPAAVLEQAGVQLVIEGEGRRVEVAVPRPLAGRLVLALATADLAPGTYTLSARLTGVAAAPPPATARHTRVAAPW